MTALAASGVSEWLGREYPTVPEPAGIIVVFVLIALLTWKELLRAAAGTGVGHRTSIRWINAASLPLLAAFVVIVVLRFFELVV